MEPASQGLLGGLQYVGLTAMSPLAGYLLQNYHPKVIICMSLFTNTICVLMFALAPPGYVILLLVARSFIGVSQACLVIYSPVWVDEFAPMSSRTLWMSLCQGRCPLFLKIYIILFIVSAELKYLVAGVPLGVMAGYTTAGFLADAGVEWRFSLFLQAFLLCPFVIGSLCVVCA